LSHDGRLEGIGSHIRGGRGFAQESKADDGCNDYTKIFSNVSGCQKIRKGAKTFSWLVFTHNMRNENAATTVNFFRKET
jgi:hypothetical protein